MPLRLPALAPAVVSAYFWHGAYYSTSNPTPSDALVDAHAKKLFNMLCRIARSDAFIWGNFDSDIEGQQFRNYGLPTGQSDVATATNGSHSGIVSYDFAGLYWQAYLIGEEAWHAHVEAMVRRGCILLMSWHAYNPVTLGASDDTSGNPISAILPGGAANAVWRVWLDRVADLMLAWGRRGIPFIFRPFHENTGSWFWWGNATDPQDYKAAWAYTVTYLRSARGVHNMLLAYSPAQPVTLGWEGAFGDGPDSRYPGDNLVDIACFDHYGFNDFHEGLVADCEAVVQFAAEHGKIPAICEYGVSEGIQNTDIADWHMSSFLQPIVESHACLNISWAMTWRNRSPNRYHVPLLGNRTYASFVDMFASPHTIFAGDSRLERGGEDIMLA